MSAIAAFFYVGSAGNDGAILCRILSLENEAIAYLSQNSTAYSCFNLAKNSLERLSGTNAILSGNPPRINDALSLAHMIPQEIPRESVIYGIEGIAGNPYESYEVEIHLVFQEAKMSGFFMDGLFTFVPGELTGMQITSIDVIYCKAGSPAETLIPSEENTDFSPLFSGGLGGRSGGGGASGHWGSLLMKTPLVSATDTESVAIQWSQAVGGYYEVQYESLNLSWLWAYPPIENDEDMRAAAHGEAWRFSLGEPYLYSDIPPFYFLPLPLEGSGVSRTSTSYGNTLHDEAIVRRVYGAFIKNPVAFTGSGSGEVLRFPFPGLVRGLGGRSGGGGASGSWGFSVNGNFLSIAEKLLLINSIRLRIRSV